MMRRTGVAATRQARGGDGESFQIEMEPNEESLPEGWQRPLFYLFNDS